MILLISLLSLLPHIHADTWSATTTNCLWNEYTTNNRLSNRIDLRDIRNQILTVALNNSIFSFNPCKTFNLPNGGDPHTAQGEQCHNVLGCKVVQKNKNSEEYFTVAIRSNSTVLTNHSSLTIRYYGAKSYANKTMHVRYECNRQIHQAQLKFVKYQHRKTPIFSLTHRCCCPNVCGGNTFPSGLLLMLLFVILFIVGAAVWIFCQCRRHYPERNAYGAVASTDLNINTLDPTQVLKVGLPEPTSRSAGGRRARTRSIVPILEDSTILSQDLKIINRLGVGELGGEVSEGRWNERLVAVKTLRIGVHAERFSADDRAYLEKEIGVLSHVRHKNLTAIIGICFDNDVYPQIILSFAEHGTIINFIRRFPTKVDWSLRLSWCINISDALAYLHRSNILHRNLKSSNILIGVDLRAHLCDYGLISILQPLREACNSERCLCKLSHPALPVSIRWSSPEILANPSDRSQFNYACDVYSFGVCLWEQVHLEQPYAKIKDEAEVTRLIVDGSRPTSFEETMMVIMPEYQQLMNDCWAVNPQERPTFERIGQILRDMSSKVKLFQKLVMKRLSSTTNTADVQDGHSNLFRFDSIISNEISETPNSNS